MNLNKRYLRNVKSNLGFYISSIVLTMVCLMLFLLFNISGNGIKEFGETFFAEHIVKLDIPGGNRISATISMEAIKSLGLEVGKEAFAIVKATSVMMANGKVNISARNQLTGTVTAINEGAVNAIVKLDVAEGVGITSTISMEAVKDLGLEVGKEATAIIKATSVMIGV